MIRLGGEAGGSSRPIDLIKYGLAHDDKRFIQSAEAVCAEEREKQHTVLANRIEKIVLTAANTKQKSVRNHTIVKSSGLAAQTLFIEKTPERRMGDLVLPEFVRRLCDDLVEEQLRADLLRSYGLELNLSWFLFSLFVTSNLLDRI